MSGRPMDPDDLDGIANMFAGDKRIEALLAAHDHWQAEAERWRSRCPATAEDVARRGVTWPHVWAWLEANGWTKGRFAWTKNGDRLGGCSAEEAINYLAGDSPLCAQDILDEMAAMEVET